MRKIEKIYPSQPLTKRTTEECTEGEIKLRSKEGWLQEEMVTKGVLRLMGSQRDVSACHV